MILDGNVSRAEVYAAILRRHGELLKIPTPPESLGTPQPNTSSSFNKRSRKARSGEKSQAPGAAELRFLFERLLVAFHPNSLPLLPCAEWILTYYPPNPAFFRSLETQREDTRNSDSDRVARVISHNGARIDQLRQTFSELMGQIQEEKDRESQFAIIGNMERLGIEWGISEARIQTVTVWFQGRWGMYEACPWF